jgi:hypothetical protein
VAIAHKVIDAGMRVAWFTLESPTASVGRAAVDGTSRQHGDQLFAQQGNDLDR